MQEVRDAIGQFRASAGEASKDGKWGGEKERFSIAVADTFGEGGPVRYALAVVSVVVGCRSCPFRGLVVLPAGWILLFLSLLFLSFIFLSLLFLSLFV